MPNLLNTYKNNYVMILFKHAFVILLTVGYFFWSRSYMSIGRMDRESLEICFKNHLDC